MKYFDIIPLTKVARNKSQIFTYTYHQELKPGTLVQISFGRKELEGIVLRETTIPQFRIKQISKVIQHQFLSPKQLKLARQIAVYYLTSLGLTTKLFVPKITRKETPCFIEPLKKEEVKKAPTLTRVQQKLVREIKKQQVDNKPFLLFGPASSGKTEVVMKIMEETLKKKQQCLLIVPEIFLSQQEIIRYKERFHSKNIIFFHSKLKQSEATFALNSVRNGEADIVISTRLGLFLPFKKLGFLAVDEEQDFSHKQWDQVPRYHAKTVAEMMTKIYKTKTIFLSSTPSLESVLKSKKDRYKLLKLPILKTETFEVKKPKIKFVDLKKLYTKKGEVPLTEELTKAIKESLLQNKIALILVPQRGQSKTIFCTDCKKKLSCPHCNLPLIKEGGEYKCIHCAFRMSLAGSCPHCRSFRLKEFGFGTEGVVKTLQRNFSKAKIELIDSTVFEKINTREDLFQKLLSNKIDILVGTYAIAKGLDIPDVELTATINVDNWSGQADFRFDEKWLSNLFQLSGRLNRANSSQKGSCIIQTYNPENELFAHLQEQTWLDFAEEELGVRKLFQYPPFSHLIRLTLKHNDQATLFKKSNKLYNELSRKLQNNKTSIQRPYSGALQKVRGRWERHISIKTTEFTSRVWQNISQITPDEWIIDVDSESIF